jgi:hypothetical protein
MHLFAGEPTAAAALIEEVQATTDATGCDLAPTGRWVAPRSAALKPWPPRRSGETSEVTGGAKASGIRDAVGHAVLYGGLGHYEHALSAARQVAEQTHDRQRHKR